VVRFSDLLGRGDEGRPEREGDRAARRPEPTGSEAEAATPDADATPNEPTPPAPNEPPPPPPPETHTPDLFERLASYAQTRSSTTPAPSPPPAPDGTAPEEHAHGEGWADSLEPVDDDLLPKDKKRR
jgi:hypothetical protein